MDLQIPSLKLTLQLLFLVILWLSAALPRIMPRVFLAYPGSRHCGEGREFMA